MEEITFNKRGEKLQVLVQDLHRFLTNIIWDKEYWEEVEEPVEGLRVFFSFTNKDGGAILTFEGHFTETGITQIQ